MLTFWVSHPFDYAQDRPERPQGAKDLLRVCACNGFVEILRPYAPQNDMFMNVNRPWRRGD
jgi:hypothetical protein